jgi:hypothetical protein
MSVHRSILKKSRHIGIGLVQFNPSTNCCLHQYKTLKAVATAIAAIVVLTPAKNLNKVFWGFLVVSPLFNHFLGYV